MAEYDPIEAKMAEAFDQYIKERVAQGYTREQALAQLEKIARDRYAAENRTRFKVVSGDKPE
jgi:hypothetical protein